MVKLYKVLKVLEEGMWLLEVNKWKREGMWYGISEQKKE